MKILTSFSLFNVDDNTRKDDDMKTRHNIKEKKIFFFKLFTVFVYDCRNKAQQL